MNVGRVCYRQHGKTGSRDTESGNVAALIACDQLHSIVNVAALKAHLDLTHALHYMVRGEQDPFRTDDETGADRGDFPVTRAGEDEDYRGRGPLNNLVAREGWRSGLCDDAGECAEEENKASY